MNPATRIPQTKKGFPQTLLVYVYRTNYCWRRASQRKGRVQILQERRAYR